MLVGRVIICIWSSLGLEFGCSMVGKCGFVVVCLFLLMVVELLGLVCGFRKLLLLYGLFCVG